MDQKVVMPTDKQLSYHEARQIVRKRVCPRCYSGITFLGSHQEWFRCSNGHRLSGQEARDAPLRSYTERLHRETVSFNIEDMLNWQLWGRKSLRQKVIEQASLALPIGFPSMTEPEISIDGQHVDVTFTAVYRKESR